MEIWLFICLGILLTCLVYLGAKAQDADEEIRHAGKVSEIYRKRWLDLHEKETNRRVKEYDVKMQQDVPSLFSDLASYQKLEDLYAANLASKYAGAVVREPVAYIGPLEPMIAGGKLPVVGKPGRMAGVSIADFVNYRKASKDDEVA